MSDLLPCPFCGGKADIDYDGSVYDGTHVYCTECDIRTESYKTKTGSTWDVDAAIAAWNRRAIPAADAAHVNETLKSEHDAGNVLTDAAQSRAPFFFDRYINGVRMAEGVCIERETTLEGAMQAAARIAAKGPKGEALVLVYRAPAAAAQADYEARILAALEPAPDLAELDAAKIIQKRIDAIIQEEGSWEPDTNVTNLPEWAETAVEELEGILAKIKEPQT